MEGMSSGGVTSDWYCAHYIYPSRNRRPTHTHTHTHSRYSDLLDQFCTHFKSIEMASIDSIVDDIVYHDGFTVHERKGAKPSSFAPCVPAAASANTEQKGTVWQTPFKWLSKAMSKKAIRTQWTHALAGMGICPICHCEDKPWHVPTKCLLLKDLNLQLEVIPLGPATQPAAQQHNAATPALLSHGVCASGTDESVAGGSSGSGNVPSGLVALASTCLPRVQEYDSDDDFCWAGDEDSCNYGVDPKDKQQFSGYMPSGSMASVTLSRVIPNSSLPVGSSPGAHRVSSTTNTCIALPETLLSVIQALCKSSI
jgi:hypothetical protein